MQTTLRRIRQSHSSNPRPLWVLYVNPLLVNQWMEAGFLTLERGDTFALLAPAHIERAQRLT